MATKYAIFSLLLFFPTFPIGQNVPLETKHSSEEQTLRRLNNEWLKAYDTGDVQALDRIESEDFTASGEFGVRTKQQQLEGIRHRPEKRQEVTRRIDNQEFRFYGDVALVTETDHASSGEGPYDDFQSTELWVRLGGAWKVVHLHYSRLDKKQ